MKHFVIGVFEIGKHPILSILEIKDKTLRLQVQNQLFAAWVTLWSDFKKFSIDSNFDNIIDPVHSELHRPQPSAGGGGGGDQLR